MESNLSYEAILLERRGHGAWITLNLPGDMNALTIKMLDEMERALDGLRNDTEIAAIVFTGSGKAFCTGANLKEILSSLHDPTQGTKDFLERIGEVLNAIRAYPKPVIAAVNGYALAGGLEFVMSCDLVLAAEDAKMGDAHSNFGILPGAGGAAVLPRKVGLNRAKYLMFTGDSISAADMERYGLVNLVVPKEELVQSVEALVEKLADKSPLVLRKMKELANAALDQTQASALHQELLYLRHHNRSYDLAEGLAAFREKRKPEFKGY